MGRGGGRRPLCHMGLREAEREDRLGWVPSRGSAHSPGSGLGLNGGGVGGPVAGGGWNERPPPVTRLLTHVLLPNFPSSLL